MNAADWMREHHPDITSGEEFERRLFAAARDLGVSPMKTVNSEQVMFPVPVYAKVLGLTVDQMMAAFETANWVEVGEPVVAVSPSGGGALMSATLAAIEAPAKPRRGTEADLRDIERSIAEHHAKLDLLLVDWGRARPATQRYRALDGRVSRLQGYISDLAEEAGITPARTRAELAAKARIAKGQYLYDLAGEVCGMDEFLMQSLVDDLIRLG